MRITAHVIYLTTQDFDGNLFAILNWLQAQEVLGNTTFAIMEYETMINPWVQVCFYLEGDDD